MLSDWGLSLQDMGIGPDDIDEPECEPPSCIYVEWYANEQCADGETYMVRTFRHFPMFMEKAAYRWKEAMERRHGKGNVCLDYV